MQRLLNDIAVAVREIDSCAVPFKSFQPGVGPYGEPQLVREIVQRLRTRDPKQYGEAKTKRVPDVLIPSRWALEFKIVRPFGDNGIEAEHWSQNLLHPYRGNVSAIADIWKLLELSGGERRGIIAVGYEHEPCRIDLDPLLSAFELISRDLLKLPLGPRNEVSLQSCIHPVHQRARILGWEIG
ncbi:hypothetical protein AYO47_01115 [Planctomyces sp. SCGC AG-212-M04]|nr:hypothetical protein AYO47_01115 [Planctomyces sp. SCGC AG-212-M04]